MDDGSRKSVFWSHSLSLLPDCNPNKTGSLQKTERINLVSRPHLSCLMLLSQRKGGNIKCSVLQVLFVTCHADAVFFSLFCSFLKELPFLSLNISLPLEGNPVQKAKFSSDVQYVQTVRWTAETSDC